MLCRGSRGPAGTALTAANRRRLKIFRMLLYPSPIAPTRLEGDRSLDRQVAVRLRDEPSTGHAIARANSLMPNVPAAKYRCKTKRCSGRSLLWLVLVLALADALGTVWHFQQAERLVAAPRPADAAAIFFAHEEGIANQPIIEQASAIYRAGLVQRIVCLGGSRPARDYYGSEVMKTHLVARGVPANAVLTERISFDTETNWEQLRSITEHEGIDSVLILGDPIHGMRILSYARKHPLPAATSTAFASNVDASRGPALARLWLKIHHEWLAYTARWLLPQPLYRRALRLLRK